MSRKFFLLFGVILVLGVFVLLEKPFQERFVSTNETYFYPTLKSEDISIIDIDYFTHNTHLEKNEKREWQVTQDRQKFPANPERVGQILAFLTSVKKGEPITTDEKKFPFLQLDEGLHLTFRNAKEEKLGGMIIGKQGPDVFSTFVRDDSESKAYLVEAYLTGLLNIPIEEWRQTDLK